MHVCEDEDTTTYLRECARRSVDVVNDVIDVRIVECQASTQVVIGIRVVLCHPLVHNLGFSTSCPNSHLVVML